MGDHNTIPDAVVTAIVDQYGRDRAEQILAGFDGAAASVREYAERRLDAEHGSEPGYRRLKPYVDWFRVLNCAIPPVVAVPHNGRWYIFRRKGEVQNV